MKMAGKSLLSILAVLAMVCLWCTGAAAYDLKAADLNGDSNTDLVYLSGTSDVPGYVYYTLNVDNATAHEWVRVGSQKIAKVVVGDFDDDSKDEIAGIAPNDKLKFAYDNATYGNSTSWIIVGTTKFKKIYAGDFDGDGYDELVGINLSDKVKYCQGNSTDWVADRSDPSTTACSTTVGTGKFKKLYVGDFNNDSTEELVGINASNYVRYNQDNSTAWVADADDPSTTAWVKVGTKKFTKLVIGVYDSTSANDGLIGINSNGVVKYCQGNSTAWVADADDPSTTAWDVKIGTKKFKQISAGNLNNAGEDELVGINMNNYARLCSDNATDWVADSADPSTTNWSTKIGTKKFASIPFAVGDYDGDGNEDIAGLNSNYQVLYIKGNNTLTFDDNSTWTKITKPSE
jgi:hypothetical protein